MMEKTLQTYPKEQEEWITNILCQMVQIPSESGHEQDMEAYLAQQLEKLGVPYERCPVPASITEDPDYSDPVPGLVYNGRGNIEAVCAGWDPQGEKVVLNSHMDVVPPSAGQTDAYRPRVEAGYLYGRGACDAKGQLAVMLLLMKAMQEYRRPRATAVCHMVVEEEVGGNGTVALLREKGKCGDCLVNMEPTGLEMQTSIRGAIWFSFSFTGVAAHAGSANRAVSALDKAIEAVGLLKQYHQQLLEQSKTYGLFCGKPNPLPLTIGRMEAGDYPSMTPCSAEIKGVLGILPNTTYQRVTEELRQLFNKPEHSWIADGMQMHFSYRHNAVELPVEHPFAKEMSAACRACGLSGEPDAMTASADAIYYQEQGIPSLAFGPGQISDAHSIRENIRVDDILKAAEVLFTLLDSNTTDMTETGGQ